MTLLYRYTKRKDAFQFRHNLDIFANRDNSNICHALHVAH